MYYMTWSHWLSGTLKPVTSELIDIFVGFIFFDGCISLYFSFFIGPFTLEEQPKAEVLSEHAEMAKAAAEVRVLNLARWNPSLYTIRSHVPEWMSKMTG